MSTRVRFCVLHAFSLILVSLAVAGCGGTTTSVPRPTPVATGAVDESPSLSPVVENESERRKTVIMDIDFGPVPDAHQWNPLLEETRLDNGLHQAMNEPFFILNYESGAIEPWLGKTMIPNEAQDVWTLRLREGVTWSDGEPLNADDVAFTFDLVLTTEHTHLVRYAGVMNEWVESVEKIDDLTVQFNLKKSNPRFQLDYFSVRLWGSFPVVPEHIWRGKDMLTFKNYDPAKGWPVFTGPYTLEDATTDRFVYVRDDDWWGAETGFRPLPRPERLIWIAPRSEAERVQRMATNQLDSLMDVSPAIFLDLQKRNPNVIAWLDTLPYAWMDPCPRLLSFNHTVQPWDDKDMRWAVNYAIDRGEIVERAYQHTTIAARHFFPSYPSLNRYIQLLDEAGLYEQYPLTTHDPQRAIEIIESKGWSKDADGYYERDGQRLSLNIKVTEAFIEKQRTAEVIVEQLRSVGIDATISLLDEETWWEEKSKGYYEAVIDWDACDSVNEPWASMSRYEARWIQPIGELAIAANNHIRWNNQEYSDLVSHIGVLPLDDPGIDVLFVQAMEIWFDELPFIPLAQARKLIPFNTTYWTNWPTAENNYIHPPTWWQSTHIIIHHLEPAGMSP